MKKKGFTLIELLAVIVVLSLIVTIAVPSTISISNRVKKNLFCSKIDFIENAAKLYGEDYRDSFTSTVWTWSGSYDGKTITIKELVQKNYLKKDNETEPYIEDPRDKNKGLDNEFITVYIKNERIHVDFWEEVNSTCER